MHEIYLPAFKAAVKKGMSARSWIPKSGERRAFDAERPLNLDIMRNSSASEGMSCRTGTRYDALRRRMAGLDLEMPHGTI